LYVPNAGHGRASGVLYVRLVNIGPGIQERHTDIYGHVCMGDFSDIGAPLMKPFSMLGMDSVGELTFEAVLSFSAYTFVNSNEKMTLELISAN